jgi:hypothetical protein
VRWRGYGGMTLFERIESIEIGVCISIALHESVRRSLGVLGFFTLKT